MADIGIYTKNAGIQAKAGAGASAVSKAVAWTDLIVLQAESFINSATRYNWSDWYVGTPTANADVKYILQEAGENLCAIYVINYDMSGYTLGRIQAEDMINILMARLNQCLAFLLDENTKKFIQGA